MNGTKGRIGLVASLVAVGLAACGQTQAKGLSSTLPSGIYQDRLEAPVCLSGSPPGNWEQRCKTDPYSGLTYQISLTITGQNTFTGTVSFIAQDGNRSVVFTFHGTAQSGTANLTVDAAPTDGSPPRQGEVLAAEYGTLVFSTGWPSTMDPSRGLTLDNCSDYLRQAGHRQDCDFALVKG